MILIANVIFAITPFTANLRSPATIFNIRFIMSFFFSSQRRSDLSDLS